MNVLEGKFQKGGGSDSGTILGLLLIYIYVVRCERGWVKSCLHMPGQQRITVDSTTGEFHPSISGDKWVKLSRNMPPFIRFHVSDVHSPEWSNEVIQQKYG